MLLKTKVLLLKADEYMCVLLYYALDVGVEKSTRDWATRFPCTNVAQVALIPCSRVSLGLNTSLPGEFDHKFCPMSRTFEFDRAEDWVHLNLTVQETPSWKMSVNRPFYSCVLSALAFE